MNIDDISENDLKQIAAINRILESRFGLRIEAGPIEHFEMVLEHYEAKRRLFLETLSEAQAIYRPEYAKAVLITEGIRLVLREVKPKRRRKRKK